MNKYNLIPERQILWGIFFAFLLVRVLFVLLSGYDSFEIGADSERYNKFSDAILAGHYNLIEPLFITAPFYPYFQALYKLIFGSNWIFALQTTQILLSSLSGVVLYKTAVLLWQRRDIAIVAAGIYCFYPFTFWWVHSFSQDMPFQYHLIFAIYFFIKYLQSNKILDLILFSILFSITFLTKSHILLFAPFIPVCIFLVKEKTIKEKVLHSAVIALICFIFTIPYGVYNYYVNGVYVISSTGQGGHFLTGHNDDSYTMIVNPPTLTETEERKRLLGLKFFVFDDLKPYQAVLSHSEMQKLYFNEGIKWIKNNPKKFLILKIYDLYYFLCPGLNPNWYPYKQWLASLIISLPIYIFAYIGIFVSLKENFRKHFWILGLFLSMIIFSVGFYVQNRFRTITIEPFYILYAAYPIANLIRAYISK